MIGLEMFGIGAFGFVLYKAWRWWVGDVEDWPPTHIAGEDDGDIDFDAALKSLDRDHPHREFRDWEGIAR